ncbi:MAG: hypothetical protein IT534_03065 [Bauldia sp.]|nr:hypothetical protein [Bauldia sp.]
MIGFRTLGAFYTRHLSVGDRLGETVYAVWMVVVSIGLINAETSITRDRIWEVIFIAFGVNLVWGVIDGVTVMFTNIIDRRKRDVLAFRLRTTGGDAAARAKALDDLEDSIAGVLSDAEKNAIVDRVAAGAAGADPRSIGARPGKEDWAYAVAIILIDVLHVVPLVLPLILIHDVETAIFVSRIIAVTTFAALGAAYARNLNRRPVLAAAALGVLGYALFSWAYAAGW